MDGKQLKQEGIERVLSSNLSWAQKATAMLPSLILGKEEITGEEIRFGLLELGLPEPSKPNAWGAITNRAVRAGLLLDSGRVSYMTDETSHGRRTPVWIVVSTLRKKLVARG